MSVVDRFRRLRAQAENEGFETVGAIVGPDEADEITAEADALHQIAAEQRLPRGCFCILDGLPMRKNRLISGIALIYRHSSVTGRWVGGEPLS